MIDLSDMRWAAGLTRDDMAERMGMKGPTRQSTIAQMEARADWHVSTIARYVTALGGKAELVVVIDNQEYRYPLGVDT